MTPATTTAIERRADTAVDEPPVRSPHDEMTLVLRSMAARIDDLKDELRELRNFLATLDTEP